MTAWELNIRIDEQLDVYSHIFDSYWDTKKIPEGHEYDALARYIKSVLDDPCTRYQGDMDALWLGLMKESLMEFFRVLLPYYIEIEEQQCRERKYMEKFFTGDLDKKRTMWRDVVDFIEEHYTPNEVNMDGYDHLLRNTDKNKDDIFDCLEQEWGNASDGEVRAMQEVLIENNRKSFENKVRQLAGTKDYKKRKELKTCLRHYPILDEIVKMIGREKEAETIERDDVITKYLPLLMKHSPIRESIDGVVSGDDLSAVLPTEIALLADKKMEGLFYQRYATKKLQLFSGKSKLLAKEKKRIEKKNVPRLTEGPIIVSIDTSGSMSGLREKVSKGLLMQLLETAKQKKRKCFLITYSVHAKAMEISHPKQWRQVRKFLEECFCGGTDCEDMLKNVLQALDKKDFEMADVLVISDFEFPYPSKATIEHIAKAQSEGTKFYGLRMDGEDYERRYDKLFDKMWTIEIPLVRVSSKFDRW